ncbi:Protein of unknown function [Rhodovulum sp. ES.010]|uniref:Tll0287-like domain-containing protein n=1 Tax=Rhodovulum sp. ES.010 TaxID=1882821 RepID=UPI00092962DA|nr:DUF3365 domain-containing protein [Rhodovulum sp. ES.010]SIO16535.1 Protein of unknown function [Rhodovulum sp. ES.010]
MRTGLIVAGLAASLASTAAEAEADEVAELAAEGQALMMSFGAALKSALLDAIEAGGPVNAIAVCNTKAPEIAAKLSTGSWTVARSSHRLRNPENAPDAFTAEAVEAFLAREAAGAPVEGLSATGIIDKSGQRVFHMVKAIPTAELCVTCHGGDTVKPPVEAKLAELYPQDRARGFAVGDMRGVFTLRKILSD